MRINAFDSHHVLEISLSLSSPTPSESTCLADTLETYLQLVSLMSAVAAVTADISTIMCHGVLGWCVWNVAKYEWWIGSGDGE